jgi:putative sterol carrier protein
MAGATEEFFNDLGQRGHEPLLEKATGTLRFDLARGKRTDRWHVAISKGDIAVSRRNSAADCVVRMDGAVFDDLAGGEENAMAALLRGLITVEGDDELVALFQGLFPGPPTSRDKRHVAGYSRRQQ